MQREVGWAKKRQRFPHRTRLKLAAARLQDSKQERLWALGAAQKDGISLLHMARGVGLSRSRVQQLLTSEPAQGIPTQANGAVRQASEEVTLRDRLAPEALLVRQTVEWFKDLLEGRGPKLEGRTWVLVNLNLDTVRQQNQLFDEERILKVLERIAGDFPTPGDGAMTWSCSLTTPGCADTTWLRHLPRKRYSRRFEHGTGHLPQSSPECPENWPRRCYFRFHCYFLPNLMGRGLVERVDSSDEG